jgi:hypothetical protein
MYRVYLASLGGWRVYLHKFVSGDGDRWLHNHPFNGLSVILSGSYLEETREASAARGRISTIKRRKWLNVIKKDNFHRIASVRDNTWTLFIHAPHCQRWGFLVPSGKGNQFIKYPAGFSHIKWWKTAKTLQELEA